MLFIGLTKLEMMQNDYASAETSMNVRRKHIYDSRQRKVHSGSRHSFLRAMFSASKEGYKASDQERHRLEGFMHAGVFLGLVTQDELSEQMETIHQSIFGVSIAERKAKLEEQGQGQSIEYASYDVPTYIRKRR